MPQMQDKEFDNLFKSTFEDAEVTPSVRLWDNIETKISPKKKTFIMKYWAVAAAILVMGATTLIIYNNNKVADQQIAFSTPIKSSPQIIEKTVPGVEEQVEEKNPQIIVAVAKSNNNYRRQEKPKERVLVENNNGRLEDQNQVLASVDQKELQDSRAVSISQVAAPKVVEIISLQEKTVLASVEPYNIESGNDKIEASADKGIRNAGDLINIVVGMVDKGKNKFIRFKTSDEGSTLAAINIGPFRFGRQTD